MADTPTLPEGGDSPPSDAQPEEPAAAPRETPEQAPVEAQAPVAEGPAEQQASTDARASNEAPAVPVAAAAAAATEASNEAPTVPVAAAATDAPAAPTGTEQPVGTPEQPAATPAGPSTAPVEAASTPAESIATPATPAEPVATATPVETPAAAGAAAAAVTATTAATPAAGQEPATPMTGAEASAREAASQLTSRSRTWWNRLDPTTRRPTLIIAAALIIAIFGSQFLNALIPVPAGANPGGGGGGGGSGTDTIPLGGGARVTPPEGWTVVGPTPNLQGVEMQKGSVIVSVMVAAYSGSPQELLATYVARYLEPEASQLTVGDVAVGTAPNGHLAARAFYVGIFKDAGTLQGEVVTEVWGAVGVIVDAAAPQGQLQAALDDIDAIISTIEVR